ncbi:MAG: hypothetical protein IAF38_22205 [Bacteroidia bacterium]|nr:hypothetical protein [Bacteroidia bacterium]
MKTTKKTKPQKLTNTELAESFVFPHGLSKKEKEQADKLFWEERKKLLSQMTNKQLLLSRLLQLKYQIEDYLKEPSYNEDYSFSTVLKRYLDIIGRKKKDFAKEIDVHETKLSQILTNRVEPNEKMMIRLELHSSNLFPAMYWFKLLEKKREFELVHDNAIRKEESKNVTNRLELSY